MAVNIINKSNNPLPTYATAGASGLDLRAHLPTPIVLAPQERQLIATGLFLELPDGYEAQVRPRSGLAIQRGLTCLNSPGTIDSDYRGEVKVIMINLGQQAQTIESGERIAQLVFQQVEKVAWQVVDELDQTVRGQGGFGSSGVK
ncbi:MAG: dUTP diphosphatase [Bacteroidetes bacterium]|nr:MAG: dUTP diphosphatase [Bacteroidota bacterium]